MKSILKEIFDDYVYSAEKLKPNGEYWEAYEKFGNVLDKLSENATDEVKKLTNDLFMQVGEMEDVYAGQNFSEGFKLGFWLAFELMQ